MIWMRNTGPPLSKFYSHCKVFTINIDSNEKTYLLPRHVCKSVAIPLTKKIVLMSFPVTTGSFTHNSGDNMIGKDNVAPNIVK